MAKISVVGEAVVVTSAIKMEDLQMVKKYRPDALILKGGEEGKTPIFGITANPAGGSLTRVGAVFSSAAQDGSGLATLTMMLPRGIENIKEYIADAFGEGFTHLEEMEKLLPAVVADITADREAMMSKIVLA